MEQKDHGKTTLHKVQSREERLKTALKANMAKRKAQARARAEQPDPGAKSAEDHDTEDS